MPARNLLFLSYAVAYAEVITATDIYIGVNAVDYSGYPDCRAEFIQNFEATANLATKTGIEGDKFKIHAPIIADTKVEIIKKGLALGVDYGLTTSCYQPSDKGEPCLKCDSCQIRMQAFYENNMQDPLLSAI